MYTYIYIYMYTYISTHKISWQVLPPCTVHGVTWSCNECMYVYTYML